MGEAQEAPTTVLCHMVLIKISYGGGKSNDGNVVAYGNSIK